MAKNIQTDKRAKLLPKKLETLLFLKYNLRAASHQTLLPIPPKDFNFPNSKEYDVDPEKDPHVQEEEPEPIEEEEEDDFIWPWGDQADVSVLEPMKDFDEDDMEDFYGFPPVFPDEERTRGAEDEED